MEKIEAIIQCGLTYQPLTIAVSLLRESYDIQKLHIVSTHSAMKGVEEVMDAFFACINYTVYGEFVDSIGSESDQSEYASVLNGILQNLKYKPIAIVASGTNWMTYHFARELSEVSTFVVKTVKAFEEKSFFPQNEIVGTTECGEIVINDGKNPIVYLQRLSPQKVEKRFFVQERSIFFLGYEVELTLQEAAMFAFLAFNGGVLDLDNDYTDEFNGFCEADTHYDNYRVFVEEFTGRFRQNISKINGKLDEYPAIIKKHLTIERKGSRYEINRFVLS